jgi:hypothetical protein
LLHASPGRCTRGFLGAESQPLAPDRTAFAQGPFAPEALPSFHATTGPCADPRASHPLSAIALWEMSWPLAPSTAGRRDLPALGLPFLSWSATSSTPAVRRVLLTSSSPTTSAFTLAIQARLPASGSTNGFTWGYRFRRGRHSLMLWPSSLLAPPGRSALRRSARGLLRSSFPSIRHLLDSRVCYPADWSIAGAGPSPARRAAVLGCT